MLHCPDCGAALNAKQFKEACPECDFPLGEATVAGITQNLADDRED